MIHNLRTRLARIACACWGFAARVVRLKPMERNETP